MLKYSCTSFPWKRLASSLAFSNIPDSTLFEEELLFEELLLLLQLLQALLERFVCKELKIPLISGHFIVYLASLRLFEENYKEDSLIDSSLAVDVEEILRIGSSSF